MWEALVRHLVAFLEEARPSCRHFLTRSSTCRSCLDGCVSRVVESGRPGKTSSLDCIHQICEYYSDAQRGYPIAVGLGTLRRNSHKYQRYVMEHYGKLPRFLIGCRKTMNAGEGAVHSGAVVLHSPLAVLHICWMN